MSTSLPRFERRNRDAPQLIGGHGPWHRASIVRLHTETYCCPRPPEPGHGRDHGV